jgi:hypothetical protein
MMVSANAQKLKGSRVVTLAPIETEAFDALEVGNNIEVFLIKSDAPSIEIEADDNLHDAISYNVSAGTLLLSASKDVSGYKKFSVKVFYNDSFKSITAKDEANVTATTDLVLSNVTATLTGSAKLYATVKSTEFTLKADDKSKTEINLTSENTSIELSKNATLKGLIASTKMTFDLYQKSTANVEGDVTDLKLRLDNNANFTGKNLTAINADVTAEGYSNCSITATTNIIINAAGKSEINITGEPKVEIKRFADSAVLAKKPAK